MNQKPEMTPQRRNRMKPGDYVCPDDGLIYCGICRTPRETVVEFFADPKYRRCVGSLCRCRTEAARREKEERELEERVDRNERRCFPAGMSLRKNRAVTFDSLRGRPQWLQTALDYVKDFPENRERGMGLLLCGSPGTGKTTTALCILNALLNQGLRCRFMAMASELDRKIEADRLHQSYFQQLSGCDLVVLDDLGTQRSTEAMDRFVFEVVDFCIRGKIPMIVTTNLSPRTLVGEKNTEKSRLYHRLTALCQPVSCTGPDWRLAQSKENASAHP